MRFLQVSDVALPHIGGVEYVVHRYSIMQRADGHESFVITTRLPNTRNFEKINKVPYHRLSKFEMGTTLISKIKKIKPNLIHSHSYIAAPVLSYFHKINPNIPILRHIHDVYIGKYEEYSGWEGSKIYERFEGFIVKLPYTGYITPSKYTKSKLVELGLPQEKIHVVHPGVDIEKFGKSDGNYLRKKYKIPEDKKIIGFVGRLSTGKGPQYLIEAARNLKNAYIILVGPNPNPKTSGILGIEDILRKSVKNYGMEDRVIFAGKIKDEEVPLYYDSFDIFCLPSISEGFGMSIAEALAAGKPVIAFNITAIPEIVKDGYNGLLAKPRDVNDLKDKLESLINDENLYEKLRANARISIARYTWENSYKKLMEVYSLYL